MCFHIAIFSKKQDIERRFDAQFTFPGFSAVHHSAGYEYKALPVITNRQPKQIQAFRWGLVPHWAKDENIRSQTLNARSETALEKPSFKKAMHSQHCLVPCSGFFEWQLRDKKKFPYFIYLPDSEIFSFAGIWDEWLYGEKIYQSFSLLTTEANPFMAKIHNVKQRMPVILSQPQEPLWLSDGLKEKEILNLCRPYKGEMEAYPVSRLITDKNQDSNQPAVHEPYFYQEFDHPKDSGDQLKLFD
ncbi:MAG: SOS response-associated peptidase [Cytophagales bacterium]|nr:SOS response-associated peptidase [Cytophagales bacterium]